MKMTGTFIFLGIDTFNGKEPGKVYKNAVFLQGTDTQKVFLDGASEGLIISAGIQPMDSVQVELEIRIGQKTYISLSGVKKIAVKAA